MVRTLGCKANLYDSQLIEQELKKRGWTRLPPESGGADLCVVNSCAVTDEADRQSRKMASRLRRENPHAAVVVTGCSAEIDPERVAGTPGVHYVVGNADKPGLVRAVLDRLESAPVDSGQAEILGQAQGYEALVSRHPIDREWPLPEAAFAGAPAFEGNSLKTRAFLKIQEGCDAFCTYCIIPYGRGPSRSLEPSFVVAQIDALAREGVREVVMTGTNIGDYGADLPACSTLDGLVGRVLRETPIERLRLSSLDPTEITSRMLELMKSEKRLCPHFHVSLQSPHSRILRLMKRKYAFEQVRDCLHAIAQAGLAVESGGPFVGMDVITGFPGETDADFEWGIEALAALPWSRLHVFPYSERAGTPATRLPGVVPVALRRERARRLGRLSLGRLRAHYERALDGCTRTGGVLNGILWERGGGYTLNYLRVESEEAAQPPRNAVVAFQPRALRIDEASGEVAFTGTSAPDRLADQASLGHSSGSFRRHSPTE